MPRRTARAVDPDLVAGSSIDHLVNRASDLKRELAEFAQRPRYERRLTALLIDAADDRGELDEVRAVMAIDHFALQQRLSDGSTVVERFVAERRPRLANDERAMVLGWRDVVEGIFEVGRLLGDAVELHNLLDDLAYRVYSNMGRAAFAGLRRRTFVIGRIVPVHPATDAWLVSGHFATWPRSAGRHLAQVALGEVTGRPELLLRNPALLRRGLQRMALAKLEGAAAKRAAAGGPTPDELGGFPDELLDADSVALIYDDVAGLNYYRDFGRLDALFADPTLVRDRAVLSQLDEYLRDESVSPLAIRRLAQRHPEGVDPVFRALLRKPGFSWPRDGEKLLQRHKKPFFGREPVPSISVVGERLHELLGAG